MTHFALNVRRDQADFGFQTIRLARTNLHAAQTHAGRTVFLYAPRDEPVPGYFGTATLGKIIPVPDNHSLFLLELLHVEVFPTAIPLGDLVGHEVNDEPFYTYSRAIRPIPPRIAELLLNRAPIRAGMAELNQPNFVPQTPRLIERERIRRQRLRHLLLEVHGDRCAFLDKPPSRSLDGLRVSTQMGHLKPLGLGGPDNEQNILPMSPETNWRWDHGLISLSNGFEILIAEGAGDEVRQDYAGRTKVRLPDNFAFWPAAEYLEWHRDNLFQKGPRAGRG